MSRWQTRIDEWLSAERHDRDDAADAAFAHVFRVLPDFDPSPDFVRRAADATWREKARRRRVTAALGVAAGVVVLAAAGAAVYGTLTVAGGWLPATMAVASGSMVWGLSVLTVVAGWGWAAAQAGSAVAGVIVMPQTAVALAIVAFVGLAALYGLQRLLRFDFRFGSSGMQCLM